MGKLVSVGIVGESNNDAAGNFAVDGAVGVVPTAWFFLVAVFNALERSVFNALKWSVFNALKWSVFFFNGAVESGSTAFFFNCAVESGSTAVDERRW